MHPILAPTTTGTDPVRAPGQHWRVTFPAIEQLENEVGYPIREVLAETAAALDNRDFSTRLAAAGSALQAGDRPG